MIGNKKVIAIIPARAGSKRLPGKNTRSLNGIPLLVYSIRAAKSCGLVDKVVVSTDSKEIAYLAENSGAEVDIREKRLSSDHAKTIDVLKDYLSRMHGFDICVTLQPTSPLRTSNDIRLSLELFENNDADAVISVCKVECPPQWVNVIGELGQMDGFLEKSSKSKRSQDFKDYYRLNGAIYCNNIDKLHKSDSLIFESNSYAYVMPRKKSVDIDTIEDFELAEFFLSKKILKDFHLP